MVINNGVIITWIWFSNGKNGTVTTLLPHSYTTTYQCFKCINVHTDSSSANYRTVGCTPLDLSNIKFFAISVAGCHIFTIGF